MRYTMTPLDELHVDGTTGYGPLRPCLDQGKTPVSASVDERGDTDADDG
jgi:hypothetical protein